MADGTSFELGTLLDDLKGAKLSTGQVGTELGFGLHQVSEKDFTDPKDAFIGAFAKPEGSFDYEQLTFRLWLDRGRGGQAYTVTLAKKSFGDINTLKNDLQTAIRAALPAADQATVSVVIFTDTRSPFADKKLGIVANHDGTLGNDGQPRAARMEFTVKGSNTIVTGGDDNFQNIETIKLGDGMNSFVFGNDYWGGGTLTENALLQAVPLVNVVARNAQAKLTIDTQLAHDENNPIVLDFRAVNQELRFNFSRVDADTVKLTVSTVQDLTLPIVDVGPTIRNQTVVFTHLDENTVIYGGRYKNTFNFDLGAVYQGHLIGGDGFGLVGTIPGGVTDKVRDVVAVFEGATTGISLASLADFQYQVENSISYSNPINISPLQLLSGDRPLSSIIPVHYVNLEDLRRPGQERTTLETTQQVLAGNLAGLAIDAISKIRDFQTTGLSGRTDNTKTANLGDVIVRGGINLVRGTDYDVKDIYEDGKFKTDNIGAILTSGGDNISVGDSRLSITPGFHILAGGSGGDTYTFNSKFWGGAVVLDDAFNINVSLGEGNQVVDTVLGTIIPTDTLDFTHTSDDLYYTVYDISTNDIQAIKDLIAKVGFDPIPFDAAANVTIVSQFDLFSSDAPNTTLITAIEKVISTPSKSYVIAVGIENIAGSRGENTVTFVDGAELGGRIEPGFGGSLVIDYEFYNGVINPNDGVSVDLGSGANFQAIPSLADMVNFVGAKTGLQNIDVSKSGNTFTVTFDSSLGDVPELISNVAGITHATTTQGDDSNNTDEVQTFTINDLSITSFSLTYLGDVADSEDNVTTASLGFDASADDVAEALNGLPGLQWFEVPDYLSSTFPNVTYQFGNASGTGNGVLGVAVGGNVIGSDKVDEITGNNVTGNTIWGRGGADTLSGDSGGDILNGGTGNDILNGYSGSDTEFPDNDILYGDSGDDELYGGRDQDLLVGGDGDDLIDGGGDVDTYRPISTANLVVFTGTDLTELTFDTNQTDAVTGFSGALGQQSCLCRERRDRQRRGDRDQ